MVDQIWVVTHEYDLTLDGFLLEVDDILRDGGEVSNYAMGKVNALRLKVLGMMRAVLFTLMMVGGSWGMYFCVKSFLYENRADLVLLFILTVGISYTCLSVAVVLLFEWVLIKCGFLYNKEDHQEEWSKVVYSIRLNWVEGNYRDRVMDRLENDVYMRDWDGLNDLCDMILQRMIALRDLLWERMCMNEGSISEVDLIEIVTNYDNDVFSDQVAEFLDPV